MLFVFFWLIIVLRFLNLRVNRSLDSGRPRTADGFLARELCSTVVKPISLRRAANATCCGPPVVARPSSLHNFASMFGNLRGHGVDDHVLIGPLRPFAGMSFAAVAARRVFPREPEGAVGAQRWRLCRKRAQDVEHRVLLLATAGSKFFRHATTSLAIV